MKNEIKFNKRVVFYRDENQETIIGFIDASVFDNYVWLDIYKYQKGKAGLSKINGYNFHNISDEIPEKAIEKWINKCTKEYFDDAYTEED